MIESGQHGTKRSSSRRGVRFAILGAPLLALVLVALAPRLLSPVFGARFAASRVERWIDGTVEVDRARLRWWGEQRFRGVHVSGPDGTRVADLDITLYTGLAALLLDSSDRHYRARVAGRLETVLDEQGTLSVARLVAPRDKMAGAVRSEGGPAPRDLAIEIEVENLEFVFRQAVNDLEIVVGDITGRLAGGRSGTIEIDLEGQSGSGSCKVEASLESLFDDQRRLTAENATFDGTLVLEGVPVSIGETEATIEHLLVTAGSAGLGNTLDVTFEGRTGIAGQSGAIDGAVTVSRPLEIESAVGLVTEHLAGRITGRGLSMLVVPSPIPGTTFRPRRDLGPRLEVEFKIEDGQDRVLSLTAKAERIDLDVHARLEDAGKWMRGSHLRAAGSVCPDLLDTILGIESERDVDYVVNVTDFALPTTWSEGSKFDRFAAKGRLAVDGPVKLVGEDLPLLAKVDVHFATEALSTGLTVGGTGEIDAVPVTFEGRVTNLIAPNGALRLAGFRVSDASADLVVTPALLARLAPGTAELVDLEEPLGIRAHAIEFNGPGNDGGGGSGQGRLALRRTAGGDAVGEVTIKVTGAKPGDTTLDAEIRGGPLVFVRGDSSLSIDDLTVQARTVDLNDQLTLTLDASCTYRSGERGEPDRGSIHAEAEFSDLVAGKNMQVAGARLDARLRTDNLGLLFLQDRSGLGAMAVTLVGGEVEATLKSEAFFARAGALDARFQSGNGWLEMHLDRDEEYITTRTGNPIRFSIAATPSVCRDFLGKIHPALEDIRSAEQPVRGTISGLRVPPDGDLSRLDGDVRIEIGAVEFGAGSGIFSPFGLFQAALAGASGKAGGDQGLTVPGVVEPIEASVRRGVLTYDRFEIQIGEHRLAYTGTVDFVKQTLDIETEVPVHALGGLTRQVGVIPTGIKVPVRTRGTFEKPKTDVEVGKLILDIPGSLLGGLLGNDDHEKK